MDVPQEQGLPLPKQKRRRSNPGGVLLFQMKTTG